MAQTLDQEEALSNYASAFTQHVLKAMEARENTDIGFQQAGQIVYEARCFVENASKN
jgi:hypothetical protein